MLRQNPLHGDRALECGRRAGERDEEAVAGMVRDLATLRSKK
jgi:hypothetical protein